MGVKPTIDTQSVKFMFFIAAHLVRTWFHVSIWLLWYEICCAQHTCEKDGFIVLHPARYYLLLLLLLQASNVTSTHNNKKTCEINASVKRERKISHAALHNKQTLMQRHNNNMRKRTVKTYFDFFFNLESLFFSFLSLLRELWRAHTHTHGDFLVGHACRQFRMKNQIYK